ncbi:MAG TPA: hypothetical protein VMS73_07285 [Anaerolineaceae bacterium]|nr:hypothetical protein [Anaerolineaceae bacterium]
MKKVTIERPRLSLVTCLGALFILGVLAFILIAAVQIAFPHLNSPQAPNQEFTVIPAPSLTPDVPSSSPGDSGQTSTPTPVPAGEMGIGAYVQIFGTGGEGLRLRSGPGTNNSPLFLGMEAEVFQIKDGPVETGGFTWWYVVAPYDDKRKGWAVQTYLSVITNVPTPTSQN